MTVVDFVAIVIWGYFLGSIPFGVIVSKLSKGIDVREHGSGSAGMTNVIRTVGAGAGASVFAADVAKGAAAVAFAWVLFDTSSSTFAWGQVAGGCAAVIGHSWPIFAGFRGGRGVATGFGCLLVISWLVSLISLAVFLLVLTSFHYVSLGSMMAVLTMLLAFIPFIVTHREPFASLVYALVVAPIIIFRHRGNIQRLVAGTEPKLGRRASA